MEHTNSGNLIVTNSIKNAPCAVTEFISLVGGKWKPIILYYLTLGPKRFGEIDVRIEGISRKVLTQQLKELERDGLITRQSYKEIPPRVEYELTDFGRSFSPVFAAMEEWAKSL